MVWLVPLFSSMALATVLLVNVGAMVSTKMLRVVIAVPPPGNVAVARMVSPPSPMAVMSLACSL